MEKLADGLKEILTSANAWMFLLFLVFAIFIIVKMSKSGLISFKGKGLRIGSDEIERTIIREQSKWAHLFIMAIKGKVLTEDATEAQNERAELILYKIYVKVIDWINYNHISANNTYVEIKQGEIKNLVYSQDNLDNDYKTPEFAIRMDGWVRELILNLIQVRKEYIQQ